MNKGYHLNFSESDVAGYMLVYSGCDIIPKFVPIMNGMDLNEKIRHYCGSFEIVRSNAKITNSAVFCCSDDFRLSQNQSINLIGTFLYGTGYRIIGDICVVKEITHYYETDIELFTYKEAEQVMNVIRSNWKEWCNND